MSVTEYNLGKYCGITFARIKPASLFTVKEEDVETVMDFALKFKTKGFEFVCMKYLSGRVLFFVYHVGALEQVFHCRLNRDFLKKQGYDCETAGQAVALLKERLQGDDFPHEIGIFLGYPLEDVLGYMAEPGARTKLCGYWKVYAKFSEKQKVFERYRRCTDCICRRMTAGHSLTEIFRIG